MTFIKNKTGITKIYKNKVEIPNRIYIQKTPISLGDTGVQTWALSHWTGSIDGVSQSGTVQFTAGNGVVTIISQSPSGQNPNPDGRGVFVSFSVAPSSGSGFTGDAIGSSVNVIQAGTGETFTLSDYVDVGIPFGGTANTVYGAWTDYAPASAAETIQFIDQTRTRTVTTTLTGQSQKQVANM